MATSVLARFSVSIFALLFLMSLFSFAGGVKNSLIEHEDAVAIYLRKDRILVVEVNNPHYVQGKDGLLAIQSDVLATDEHNAYVSLQCTSYFSVNYAERSMQTKEVVCTTK